MRKFFAGSRRALTVASMALGMLVLSAYTALAQTPPPDPTGGAGATIVSDVKDWVTNYGVAILIGLLVLGIVLRLMIRFVKRASRSV